MQGARSALQVALKTAPEKATHLQRWMAALYLRKGYHKTLVAIANQHARILWALLVRDQHFDPNPWQPNPRAVQSKASIAYLRAGRRRLNRFHALRPGIASEVRPNVGTPRLSLWSASTRARPISAPRLGRKANWDRCVRLVGWPASDTSRRNKAGCTDAVRF